MAITRHTKHEIIDHVDSTSFEIKKDTHLKLIFQSVCEIHSYITIIEGCCIQKENSLMTLQQYKHGGFPPSSKLLNKLWTYENHKRHRKKLQNVKPFLDLTPPKEHQHLQLSVKKIQMQQERQDAIDRQNQVILSALMKIKQSKATVDNWNKDWKPSNDRLRGFRERKERRIKLENEKQRERLKKVQPYYDVQEWEKDFKKHQYYLWMLDGGTKDYGEVEDGDEQEEEQSGDERLPNVESPEPEKNAKQKKEEQVKLPPIDKKKKDANGKKKDDYPDHVVIMDAEDICKAIEENNKEKILEILGRVSEKKKLDQLKMKYKELYDKELIEEVKPKLDEEMQMALECLGSGAEEDSKQLYEAMKGIGTDDDILIEILCTRSNAEMRDIRAAYSKKYNSTLEEDLKGDTSGDLETLLVQLSKGERDESSEIDKELAKKDAKEIMEAGVAKWGTDEGKFISIFTLRSRPQLGATFPEYKKLSKADIADSIDHEMDGDLQKAFLTLVKCIRDPTSFHSDKLHKALQEGDTKTLARIILNKSKTQLTELAAAYKKVYKVVLADAIEKKCSGDLKTTLLAKLGKKGQVKEKQKRQQKPTEKPAEKTKNAAAKEKAKPKQAAALAKDKASEKKKKKEEAAVEKDADELTKAIEADNKLRIVDLLAKNCSDESKLKKLQDKYKKKQNKDLLEALKPILDEDLQEAVESLLMDSAIHDAKSLYYAMKGLGTDEDILIEILCTRNNAQMKEINEAYERMYENSLETDLKGDTSGDLETLLVQLSKGQRDESTKVDNQMAKNDAKELQEAGVANWGTDEGKFIHIFTLRSKPQLGATFPEYKKLTNMDITESIDAEMDGDMQKAFMTLVKCSRDPISFRLGKLQRALTEKDTKAVASIILTKNKAQIDELAAAYKRSNKVELAGEVDKKCEGDMKTLILAKLGRAKEASKKQQKPGDKQTGDSQNAAKLKSNEGAASSKVKGDPVALMEKDLDELHKAIDDGIKNKVVDVIARHCDEKSKLKELKEKYKQKHGQDLLETLKPILDEEQLQDAVESLFMEASSYDAKLLYNAMKGLGTDEDILIEILCARNNAEMQAIGKAYSDQYGGSLEKDIKGDTSGDFEDLLVELTKGKRDESSKVDKNLAKTDAEALMQAGFLGTDKSKFTEVFTQRSFTHLRVMFQEYKRISNQEMETSIEEEMNQDMEKGFSVLVKYSRDPANFYAAKLYDSFEKDDTDTAGRLILTSTTVELADIIAGYKALYKRDLSSDAETKFSENMKKLILPRLKKGGQKRTEKEKPGNASKKSVKQVNAAGKKAPTKSDSNKKSTKTSKKKAPQDDNMDYSELRDAIDSGNQKKVKDIVCRNLESMDKAKKLVDDYNSRYGKELFESLEDNLDEDLLEALVALSLSTAQYDARTLNLAMTGFFTKELVLIEMFSTRTNEEIAAIRQAYKKKYRKDLIAVIKDETSGDFETLLVELCKGQREEGEEINNDLAHKDAESLLEAGIKKWGTDEETFIEIFTTRSFAQLRAMLPEYKKWAKCEMEDTISSEMSGDLCEGLQILVKCIRNKDQFLADKLQEALKDNNTKTVTRRILGESYNTTYKPELSAEVNKKCSNELKKVLLPKLKGIN
ncbi:uncharacterized protein [Acropora muricata]|uniref:uncharacterized protein isoform X1 n=1 Tax=Acropora muricata TaxID=159855 RepID=UPI0034E4196C